MLIFLDLNMPVMNGYQAAKKIRSYAQDKDQLVWIVGTTSSFVDSKLTQECKSFGFDQLIQKPVRKERLKKIIKKFYN